MGLLDDAIREHLELKRRRGADPEEVARQESEALGDPRAPQPEAAAEVAGPADVTPVTPDDDATMVVEPEEPAGSAPVPATEPADGAELGPAGPEPADEPELGAAGPEPADEPGAEPDRPAAVSASAREESWLDADPPTAEHHPPPAPEPEAVAPDEETPADEDVLEETPDFLQETPEHDRLWFEQKPPRDFDFDS